MTEAIAAIALALIGLLKVWIDRQKRSIDIEVEKKIREGREDLKRQWLEELSQKHRVNLMRALKDVQILLQQMQRIVESTNADRMLIVKTHNGGGTPRPGHQVRVTVLHECTNGSVGSCIDSFQKWVCDAPYIKMLTQLLANGKVHMITDDMETSVLKKTYQAIGIKESIVRLLFVTTEGMYYASISAGITHGEGLNLSSHDEFTMMGALGKIKESLIDYEINGKIVQEL